MNQNEQPEIIHHTDKRASSLPDTIRDTKGETFLLLLVGPYQKGKKKFFEQLEDSVGELNYVDLRNIVSKNENETFQKMDNLFSSSTEQNNLCITHADVLCGEYTAYTYSNIRYATPYSRYLLKHIQSYRKLVVLDFKDFDSVDKTLKRFSQVIIRFNGPASGMDKFFWKLKQIHVHGHEFTNKRMDQ